MKKKRNAAPVCCTVDGDSGQIMLAGFDYQPTNDYIKMWVPAQGSIASFLIRGKQGALTTRELARIAGLQPRRVTRAICDERRAGAPIISDSSGFWLASDADEITRCASALHRRAGQIHATARALEAVGKVDGIQ